MVKSVFLATHDPTYSMAMGHFLASLEVDRSVTTTLEDSLSTLAQHEFDLVAIQANFGHRREDIYTGPLKIYEQIKPLVDSKRTRMALFANHLVKVSLLIDPQNSGVFDYLKTIDLVNYLEDLCR